MRLQWLIVLIIIPMDGSNGRVAVNSLFIYGWEVRIHIKVRWVFQLPVPLQPPLHTALGSVPRKAAA